jgi:hypothetical protein
VRQEAQSVADFTYSFHRENICKQGRLSTSSISETSDEHQLNMALEFYNTTYDYGLLGCQPV